jgi:hypothetical protein
MKREYYILWYRLDKKDSYLIWFSTEEDDGVFIDKSNFVPGFSNIQDLQNYCEQKKIVIKTEELLLHDLDIVKNWLSYTKDKIEDYNPLLVAWNLFDDFSNSIKGDFDKDRDLTNNIYNKIFWGCNIPAMTPEGESFTPSWTKKELKIIRETLNFGFQMFREKVRAQ